jgi:hypothetical protein
MSPLLRQYLNLESVMLSLDALDDPAADRVRDAMDPLWHRLPPEDRAWLNARALRWDVPHGSISLPLSTLVVRAPPRVEPAAVPATPILGWRRVA